MEKQIHVWISGIVQGVGYRFWTKNEAQKLNLKGWVRNLPDGRVEAVFQGEIQDIVIMLKNCRQGSSLASVDEVESNEEELEKLDNFKII